MKIIRFGLATALVAVLAGCVGYVDGGYGGAVFVPVPGPPDVFFFGGIHERGRDERDYGHRGSESRAVAHPRGRAEVKRR